MEKLNIFPNALPNKIVNSFAVSSEKVRGIEDIAC